MISKPTPRAPPVTIATRFVCISSSARVVTLPLCADVDPDRTRGLPGPVPGSYHSRSHGLPPPPGVPGPDPRTSGARPAAGERPHRAERGPPPPGGGGRGQDRAPALLRTAGLGIPGRADRGDRVGDGAAVRRCASALRADARPARRTFPRRNRTHCAPRSASRRAPRRTASWSRSPTLSLLATGGGGAALAVPRGRRSVARHGLGSDRRLRGPPPRRGIGGDGARAPHPEHASLSSRACRSSRSEGSPTRMPVPCSRRSSRVDSTTASATGSSKRPAAIPSRCWSCRGAWAVAGAGRWLRASRRPGTSRSHRGALPATHRRTARGDPATDAGGGRRPGRRCAAGVASRRGARCRAGRSGAGGGRAAPRDRVAGEVPPSARTLRALPVGIGIRSASARTVRSRSPPTPTPTPIAGRGIAPRRLRGPTTRSRPRSSASAGRAQARGGLAAAAAFLERSANLTADPADGAERLLAAVQCNVHAGAFDAALELLAEADAASPGRARACPRRPVSRPGRLPHRARGARRRPSCSKAARRLETLDPALARETYLDAWGAALFAGRLANADAARGLPSGESGTRAGPRAPAERPAAGRPRAARRRRTRRSHAHAPPGGACLPRRRGLE